MAEPLVVHHDDRAHGASSDSANEFIAKGSLADRLWADALPLAYASLHHPFVSGVASGALPRGAWIGYVAQDAHYLRHFASSYAAVMDKLEALAQVAEQRRGQGAAVGAAAAAAPATSGAPLAEQGPDAAVALRGARARVALLLSGVLDELRLHGGFCERMGVPAEALARGPAPATEAYTSFLSGISGDPRATAAEALAAMAPCLRLYAWIAGEIKGAAAAAAAAAARGPRGAAADAGGDGNPYREWVDTYSSEEYLAIVPVCERLLDELGSHADFGEFWSFSGARASAVGGERGRPPPGVERRASSVERRAPARLGLPLSLVSGEGSTNEHRHSPSSCVP